MTEIPTIIMVAGAPFAGLIGFTLIESNDPLVPWIAGFAVTVFTLLMVPVVRWMMSRMDGDRKEHAAMAQRREDREEKRQEAFQTMVGALASIANKLEELSEHHRKLDEAISDLPDKITRRRA